jgi:hypothetical protein
MVEYHEETIATIPEIIEQLADVNQEESGFDLPLNVSIDMYIEPYTKVFTMRDGSQLVGYAVFFLMPHQHYSNHIFAMNDVIYVMPGYRLYSKNFFTYVESKLDVDVVQYTMNYDKPHTGMMEALGYTPSEIVFHKVMK